MLAERLGRATGQDGAARGPAGAHPALAPARAPLIDRSPEARLPVAWGESYADWIRKRLGHLPPVPDGVAFVESGEQVRALLHLAHARSAGWSFRLRAAPACRALDCPAGERPVLSLPGAPEPPAAPGCDQPARHLWRRHAGAAGRGATARPGLHAGAFSAVVRILHRGRLGGRVQRAAVAALRAHRAAPAAAWNARGPLALPTCPPPAPGRTCARSCSAPKGAGRADRGHRARLAPAGARELSRPLPARLGRRRGRRARAGARAPAAVHAAAVQRHRNRDQPAPGRP
jgi:hypothetical protein